MIRLDADVNDMSEQDIKDTLPVISKEFTEWLQFANQTEILSTAQYCIEKAMKNASKKGDMINRLSALQAVEAPTDKL